jgi:tungstate transport system ATP-binding protein
MRAISSDLPIVLNGVSLMAGATTILDQLNLTIGRGGPTLIVGPNGSGKTSLLRLCMGLAHPAQGRVSWGGRTDGGPGRRAFLFQKPVMLRRSAAANLAYALSLAGYPRGLRRNRIDELLHAVGLDELALRPACRLSGGEQQRLALARALARQPEILLLDEPTASLDPAATRLVEKIIQVNARSGTKVIMATHDLGQVRRLASDVVFLVRGRICEHASVADFFDRPATRQAAAFVGGDLVLDQQDGD